MRRHRAPKQPHVTSANAGGKTVVHVGASRGGVGPPPPAPQAARVFVYRMMVSGASAEQAAELDAAMNVPPFGREMVFALHARICKELGDAANLPEHVVDSLRAQQRERLRRDLVSLRATPTKTPALWNAIRGHEALLADIEGTRKPIVVDVTVDVDVRVRSAMMRVVGDFTAEELAEIGREQLALEGGGVIDTTGVPR